MPNNNTKSNVKENSDLTRENAEAELLQELSKGEKSVKEAGWRSQEDVEKEINFQ